jgi:hypothetical protein
LENEYQVEFLEGGVLLWEFLHHLLSRLSLEDAEAALSKEGYFPDWLGGESLCQNFVDDLGRAFSPRQI